jgi:hypothetical protein
LRPLDLSILPETFAISRLDPAAPVPAWAAAGELSAVARTAGELSIVSCQDEVPEVVTANRGWRAVRVAGPLDFSETGVLASLATPLADAGITIFALSTHDTDYVLVREDDLARTVAALAAAGHRFLEHKP